jgi:3-oxoacyl-[acyl-carrier-protein] synthase-3
MTKAEFAAGRHFYALDPDALHPQAEQALADVLAESLALAGVARDGVALTLVHYLDPRVARRAAERAGLVPERTVATAEVYGHVAAGGLPIALADARASGRVSRGDVVACVAFGAGVSWGGAVLRL